MEYTISELDNFEILNQGYPFFAQSDGDIDTLNFEILNQGYPFFGVQPTAPPTPGGTKVSSPGLVLLF